MSDQTDDTGTPVDDNPNPPIEAVETPPPAEVVPEAPPEKPFNPSSRDDIAARFRAKRDSESEAADEVDPMGVPAFIRRQEAEAAREAEAAAEAAREPEPAPAADPDTTKYRLKVYGNDVEVTREEMVRMAGLEPSEAAGLPIPTLLKAAQLTAAAEHRLNDARERRQDPPLDAGKPAVTAEDPELPAGDDDHIDPEIAEAVQDIVFGDPTEATKKLSKAIANKISNVQTRATEDEYQSQLQKAVSSFQERHADLLVDEFTVNVVGAAAMQAAKDALVEKGMRREDVDLAIQTPAQAGEALSKARARGLDVPQPADVLETAAALVRTRLNMPGRTEPALTPRPPAPAPTDRRDAKRSLSPQPARASVPPAVAPLAPVPAEQRRSSVVADMRRGRGQTV